MNGYMLGYSWHDDDNVWHSAAFHSRQNAINEMYRLIEEEACEMIIEDEEEQEEFLYIVDTSTGRYGDFVKDQDTLDKLIALVYSGDLIYTIDEIRYKDDDPAILRRDRMFV